MAETGPVDGVALATRDWIRSCGPRTRRMYALVDAARRPEVPALLEAVGDDALCLFAGDAASALREVAPYLVRIDRVESPGPLLDGLLNDSWGWFLYTDAAPAEARNHLRKYNMVRAENGQTLYFRYYDPRVVGPYLDACRPRERRAFFGCIEAIGIALDERSLRLLTVDDDQQLDRTDARASMHETRAWDVDL